MPPRLSAIEAVTPAFAQTKRQLFKPFRWRRWAQLATVSLVTGEFAGEGGGGWSGGNFSVPDRRGKSDLFFLSVLDASWGRLEDYLPWIILGVLILISLVLLWLYMASVYRFILFDSVLNDRCELRAGWHRWKQRGSSFFLWNIALGLAMPAALLVAIGGPILLAWQTGIFSRPREHLVLLIFGGVLLFFLLVGVVVLGSVVALFAKDFAVPLMAIENLGVMDAWRRLMPMLGAEKMAYAGYVLMKIVLAVGSAIIFGIINLIVILVLLIPLGLGGVALYLFAKAAGLMWTVGTISAAVFLGGTVLMGLIYVIAFISTPAMVFFQSYTLHFFGSRYPTLGTLVFAAPPAAPATAEPSPGLGA